MNINPSEFLTDEQKTKLADAFFNKMLEEIQGMEFSKTGKINLNEMMGKELERLFDDIDIFETLDMDKVGKVLTDRLLKAMKAL